MVETLPVVWIENNKVKICVNVKQEAKIRFCADTFPYPNCVY